MDAYALQHPGDPDDRRARQSVWWRYALLEAVFGRGMSLTRATALMNEQAGQTVPPFVGRPEGWPVTLADDTIAAERDHAAQVRCWAECASASWRQILRP